MNVNDDLHISAAGQNLIKGFELCKLKAYQDGAGVWTIGWGTTSAAGIVDVHSGLTCTQASADSWFLQSLKQYEDAIRKYVHTRLSQHEYDALVSLVYNIGTGSFEKSTLLIDLNAKEFTAAHDQFARWNRSGGVVVRGLTNRRAKEAAYFGEADVYVAPAAKKPDVPVKMAAVVAPKEVKVTDTKAKAVPASTDVTKALPGVDFFQGAVNTAEHLIASLESGAKAIVNPAVSSVTGTVGSTNFFGTLDNVKNAATKITSIVGEAKAGDVQDAVADGIDLLKLVFAVLDTFHVNVPILSTVIESLPDFHKKAA